jgi:hypothetical protein
MVGVPPTPSHRFDFACSASRPLEPFCGPFRAPDGSADQKPGDRRSWASWRVTAGHGGSLRHVVTSWSWSRSGPDRWPGSRRAGLRRGRSAPGTSRSASTTDRSGRRPGPRSRRRPWAGRIVGSHPGHEPGAGTGRRGRRGAGRRSRSRSSSWSWVIRGGGPSRPSADHSGGSLRRGWWSANLARSEGDPRWSVGDPR